MAGGCAASTRIDFQFSFDVEKRVGPTAAIFNSTSGLWQLNGATNTITSLSGWAGATVRSFGVGVSASAASFTVGQVGFINGGALSFSSEL